MSVFPVRKIVVIGTGLMGGSLGMAIRRRKLAREVVGMDSDPAALINAEKLRAIDRAGEDRKREIQGADLVVLATPVGQFEKLAIELKSHLLHKIVVTDVGSVKGGILEKIEDQLLPEGLFVGGHPIAGREKSGVKAASPDLFDGAQCILSCTSRTDKKALEFVKSLWEAVGSRVTVMDPVKHDHILGAVSHLPHVVAYALVTLLLQLDSKEPGLLSYSGGGLRDFTRIAMSSSEMWRDIFLANRDQVAAQIEEYQKVLEVLKRMILQGDAAGLQAELERVKEARGKLNPDLE